MTNFNAITGKALRNLRKKTGKTQETLAFDAGLDRTYISMLELGQCSQGKRIKNNLLDLCDQWL